MFKRKVKGNMKPDEIQIIYFISETLISIELIHPRGETK